MAKDTSRITPNGDGPGTNNRAIAPGETDAGDKRAVTRSSPGMVVVACKIPNGVIIQLSTPEKESQPVMGGGQRDVTVWRKTGRSYHIRGPRVPYGVIPTFTIAGGFALTHGIPADFWEQWLDQNKGAMMVERGLIFAHQSVDHVEDRARDNEDLLSGLEPINPGNLPRGIQTAEEQKAKPSSAMRL